MTFSSKSTKASVDIVLNLGQSLRDHHLNYDQKMSSSSDLLSESFSSLPPLDHITVDGSSSSFLDADDTSSVGSSVDHHDDCKRRSIFNDYWIQKGESPARLSPTWTEEDEESLPSMENDQDNHMQLFPSRGSASPSRRTIFKSMYASDPQLSTLMGIMRREPENLLRKTQSASALRPSRPSCLRSRSSSITTPSVSFRETVQVVLFAPSSEIWESNDWNDYFAV